jgi:hypothetical protein
MYSRTRVVLAVFAALPALLSAQSEAKHSYIPPNGFVPDSATAVRIAEAVWIPIYGEKQMRRERPFVAHLSAGVWTVEGTLPRSSNPKWNAVGGVAVG